MILDGKGIENKTVEFTKPGEFVHSADGSVAGTPDITIKVTVMAPIGADYSYTLELLFEQVRRALK